MSQPIKRRIEDLPTGAFLEFRSRKGKVLVRDEGMSEIRWQDGTREVVLWSDYTKEFIHIT